MTFKLGRGAKPRRHSDQIVFGEPVGRAYVALPLDVREEPFHVEVFERRLAQIVEWRLRILAGALDAQSPALLADGTIWVPQPTFLHQADVQLEDGVAALEAWLRGAPETTEGIEVVGAARDDADSHGGSVGEWEATVQVGGPRWSGSLRLTFRLHVRLAVVPRWVRAMLDGEAVAVAAAAATAAGRDQGGKR